MELGKVSDGPWYSLTEVSAAIITWSAPLKDKSEAPNGQVKWEKGGLLIKTSHTRININMPLECCSFCSNEHPEWKS
jgi:hypothetical protein